MCSFFIAMELKNKGEVIDVGKLMAKAVIHDIEEVIVGDIASPTKYHSLRLTEEIQDLSSSAARHILSAFDSSEDLFHIWETSKKGTEGYIVALADKLAVVYKIQQEVEGFGNHTIRDHEKGLEGALDRLEAALVLTAILNQLTIRDIIQEAREICQAILK